MIFSQSCVNSPFTCSLKVLADIELAQTLKSESEKSQEETIEEVPHPLDKDYNSLKCELTLMDKDTEPFKVLCYYVMCDNKVH